MDSPSFSSHQHVPIGVAPAPSPINFMVEASMSNGSSFADNRMYYFGAALFSALVLASFASIAYRAYQQRNAERPEQATVDSLGQFLGFPGPNRLRHGPAPDWDALLTSRNGAGSLEMPGAKDAGLLKTGLPVCMPGDNIPTFVAEPSSPPRSNSLKSEGELEHLSPAAPLTDVAVTIGGGSNSMRNEGH